MKGPMTPGRALYEKWCGSSTTDRALYFDAMNPGSKEAWERLATEVIVREPEVVAAAPLTDRERAKLDTIVGPDARGTYRLAEDVWIGARVLFRSDDRQAVKEAAHILRQVTLNRDPRHNPLTPVSFDARLEAESWLAQWEPANG